VVKAVPLPDGALLERYRDGVGSNAYTDCYSVSLQRLVGLPEFVAAFYTGAGFKLERLILGFLVAKPSTDAQARKLARGETDRFAAWQVEARDSDQILLCDFKGRTRSWLMVKSAADTGHTTLYFGSAVVHDQNAAGEKGKPSLVFRLLSGFHRLYSKVLLASARRKLLD
jgi:hypothetical protein